MIGQGHAHVRTVVAIAQSQALDGTAPPCIEAFASLGNFGESQKNEERDLHTWLRSLFGLELEVYWTHLNLQVLCLVISLPNIFVSVPMNVHIYTYILAFFNVHTLAKQIYGNHPCISLQH